MNRMVKWKEYHQYPEKENLYFFCPSTFQHHNECSPPSGQWSMVRKRLNWRADKGDNLVNS